MATPAAIQTTDVRLIAIPGHFNGPTTVILVLLGAALCILAAVSEPGLPRPIEAIVGLFCLFTVVNPRLGWRIEIDDAGVSVAYPWRTHRMPWSDMANIRLLLPGDVPRSARGGRSWVKLEVAPTGDVYDDPGPNFPQAYNCWWISDRASRGRVATFLRESARRNGVPYVGS